MKDIKEISGELKELTSKLSKSRRILTFLTENNDANDGTTTNIIKRLTKNDEVSVFEVDNELNIVSMFKETLNVEEYDEFKILEISTLMDDKMITEGISLLHTKIKELEDTVEDAEDEKETKAINLQIKLYLAGIAHYENTIRVMLEVASLHIKCVDYLKSIA